MQVATGEQTEICEQRFGQVIYDWKFGIPSMSVCLSVLVAWTRGRRIATSATAVHEKSIRLSSSPLEQRIRDMISVFHARFGLCMGGCVDVVFVVVVMWLMEIAPSTPKPFDVRCIDRQHITCN